MAIQALDVYLGNRFAGKLVSEKAVLSFSYSESYLQDPQAMKLSASLPLQREPFGHNIASSYFSGLLPDENVRERVARYLRISAKNTFSLLREIGGECAGAVSVYPEGVSPVTQDKPSYKILNEHEASDVLMSLSKRPLLVGEEDIRISGAGAQDKMMVAFVHNQLAIPKRNTPSTHIIKPAIKDLEDTVHNEFFCMRLAKASGLPTPHVEIYWVEEQPYYLVERYDRRKESSNSIIRLHQEDFCQALYFPPEHKYENEEGPSLLRCFELLDDRISSGSMAGINKLTLLKGVIFNFLIGNGDAHGKNFSILYEGGAESLAPFYDLMSTLIYTNAFKAKMAMQISGRYKFKDLRMRHWERLGETLGFRSDFTRRQIYAMIQTVTREALSLVASLNQEKGTSSPIYGKIYDIISQNTAQLLQNPTE